MRKLIFPLIIVLLFSACEKNNSDDLIITDTSNAYLKAGNQVAICHKSDDNWNVINISINAWPSHEAHGDAIDIDGDGYFDRECGCSEVDCDDNDPDVTTDCGSQDQEESPIPVEYGGTTLYVYPFDNSSGSRWSGAEALCADLSAFGFEDWYLPSKEELNAMYNELDADIMVGTYWSSTTDGFANEAAWYQDFNTGIQRTGSTAEIKQCRCVRK